MHLYVAPRVDLTFHDCNGKENTGHFFHIKCYYVIRKDTGKCSNKETHSKLHVLFGVVHKKFSFKRRLRRDGNGLELK